MEGETQIKLEEKLKKLIEKYGKRSEPIDTEKFLTDMGVDLDEVEDLDELMEEMQGNEEVDLRSIEYHFNYERVKNESFKLTADFEMEKTQGGRFELHILFYDEDTVELLREIIEDPDLYNEPATLSTAALHYAIHDLRIHYHNPDKDPNYEKFHTEDIKRILDLNEELFKEKYKKIDTMIDQGMIDFSSLWYYLDRRNKVYMVKQFDHDICFRYKVFSYQSDVKDEFLALMGEIIQPSDGEMSICEFIFQIPKFTGTKKLETLKVKPLDLGRKEEFLKNGHQIVDWRKGIHHMKIDGKHFCSGPQDSVVAYQKHERVILDYEGMQKYANSVVNLQVDRLIEVDSMVEDDYLIVFPMVPVYNLGINKQWGITHISSLSHIEYKKDAFDFLVLDETKKSIIKCLINYKNQEDEYTDFIEGKGNGLVFLLYGSPGTGKTFTAEATCEFLQKPLYSINVGDLGTDPEHMEAIMNEVLDYVKRWDAIVMMDEVDVFLEEREMSNIIRNAMVGIFLKILEYHDGIIFLTTNRLESLDSAIKSRINLMISYHDLDTDRRKMIWEALFKKWKIEVEPYVINQLCKESLNGREIRNYMKIVFAVHKERKIELTGESILATFNESLALTKEFTKSVGQAGSMYL